MLAHDPILLFWSFLQTLLFVGGFVLAVFLAHFVYFVYLPQRATEKYEERDPARLRRYLRRRVATPSLSESVKLKSRRTLARLEFASGQYAAAAEQLHAVLEILATAWRSVPRPSLAADAHRRLADCCDALGQVDEAAEQRRRAAEAIETAPDDPARHITRGILLERENRFGEAYAAYQRALELTDLSNTPGRVHCLCHLLLTAYHIGRLDDCLELAEQAIASGAAGKRLTGAHKMAGIACGNLGRLDESERHLQQAYDGAVAENNTAEMASALCLLGGCLATRGKLAEAQAACIEADAMDSQPMPISLVIQAQVLSEWGRYDDALAILARARHADRNELSYYERRTMAILALDIARIELECGRGSDAWTETERILPVLRGDPKFDLRCDAILAWVLAEQGSAEESRRVAGELELRLAPFAGDPSTRRSVLNDLGRAACVRGDHQAGIDCWTRYLALNPEPVNRPTAHYHRGECHRQLGQVADAERDYAAAVALNLDTHFTRLARRRLSGFTDL